MTDAGSRLPRCRRRAARHRRRSRSRRADRTRPDDAPTRRRRVHRVVGGRRPRAARGGRCRLSGVDPGRLGRAKRTQAASRLGGARGAEGAVARRAPQVRRGRDRTGRRAHDLRRRTTRSSVECATPFRPPRSMVCSSRSRSPPGSSCSSACREREAGTAPVLTVGIGGTAVEIYGDIATALRAGRPPTRRSNCLDRSGRPLLDGFRGSTRVDVDAAARDPPRSLRLGDHFGDALVDLEVNPLLVHRRGGTGRLRVPASERSAVSGHDSSSTRATSSSPVCSPSPPVHRRLQCARDPRQRDVGPVLRRPGRRRRVTPHARGGAGFHGLGHDRPGYGASAGCPTNGSTSSAKPASCTGRSTPSRRARHRRRLLRGRPLVRVSSSCW